MKYLFLICVPEGVRLDPKEEAAIGPDTERWVAEMDGRGVRLMGQRLAEVASARCVRVRKGRISTTDGPFAETKEQVAGFDIIECAGMEEAVEIASKHPVARFGTVEIRAFWSDS